MKFLGSSTYSASNSSHGEQHMTFLPQEILCQSEKVSLYSPYSGNNESWSHIPQSIDLHNPVHSTGRKSGTELILFITFFDIVQDVCIHGDLQYGCSWDRRLVQPKSMWFDQLALLPGYALTGSLDSASTTPPLECKWFQCHIETLTLAIKVGDMTNPIVGKSSARYCDLCIHKSLIWSNWYAIFLD